MGKKATSKLLKKVKKKVPQDAIKGKGKRKSKADSLSTHLNRQQKRMKLKKRQRTNAQNDSDEEEDDEENKKRKMQKNWIVDPDVNVGKEDAFDPETASKIKSKKKKAGKEDDEDMNVDDFLAGGFMQSDSEEDSDAEEESDAEEVEDVAEDEENDDDEEEEEDDEDEEDEDEFTQHKQDLEKLKETDPEFYEHLTKNAKELLDFGKGEDEEESEKESEDEQQEKETSKRPILTSKLFRQIVKNAVKKKSEKGIRNLVAAFRSGCHIADPEGMDAEENVGLSQQYVIVSSAVYQNLMVTSLRNVHGLFKHQLGMEIKDNEDDLVSQSPWSRSKKWKRFQNTIKSFLSNLVHLLTTSTDPSMLKFLLQSCRHYADFFLGFRKSLVKKYLKVLVEQWGNSEDGAVRVAAFLRIRQLAVLSMSEDDKIFENCLKSSYLCFVRGSKFSTERTIERISMQARCLVELFGLNLSTSYQLGFVYIRQLALHLRSAISSKTVERVKNVYSWQYIHCLKVWGAILCAYPGKTLKQGPAHAKNQKSTGAVATDQEELRPLIYPLVQVIIGTIQLVPTQRNYPVRIQCLKLLVSLGRVSRTYIPVAPLALDLLQNPDLFRHKPVQSTAKPPNLDYTLRLNKDILPTNQCLDLLVTSAISILRSYHESNRFAIGFPEAAFPTQVALRSFAKKCKVTRWRSQARSLITAITNWSQIVQQKRTGVSYAPKDIDRMNTFMSAESDAAALARERQEAGLDIAEAAAQMEDSTTDEEEDDVEQDDTVASKEEMEVEESEEEEEDEDQNAEGEDIVEDLQMSDSDDDE